jgi:hypothetical protein
MKIQKNYVEKITKSKKRVKKSNMSDLGTDKCASELAKEHKEFTGEIYGIKHVKYNYINYK